MFLMQWHFLTFFFHYKGQTRYALHRFVLLYSYTEA